MPLRSVRFGALLLLLFSAAHAFAQKPAARVYVTLWFDTEDYLLTEDDDATKRLAEMLTRLGVRATFKVVGEKARVLEQRNRTDVIAALKKHEVGYHSNLHSVHPTPAVYLQNAGMEDGAAEFERRERGGVEDIKRIFGVPPSCYGQPGSSWGVQTYAALKRLGIGMYLDEANHVGINDQPFYYCGMLNVFKMRSNVARMELSGPNHAAEGKEKFMQSYRKLRGQGGGTISIYYHPNEWVQREFWDAVNFSHGANPPREAWKRPGVKTAAETEQAFRDFEEYVTFIKAQPGVQFVTASELTKLYADRAAERPIGWENLNALARAASREITFQQFGDVAYSGADTFALLTMALLSDEGRDARPHTLRPVQLLGPTRPFVPSPAGRPESVSWGAFRKAAGKVFDYVRSTGRVPDEVRFQNYSISPEDYLATLAAVVEKVLEDKQPPAKIKFRTGKVTAVQYVAEDSPKLWNWVIHPAGFHAPKIMELARLQAWTLKPALLPTNQALKSE